MTPRNSLVVPVYRNEENIEDLLAALRGIWTDLKGDFEAVFVVDGSPDASYPMLRRALPDQPFASQLLAHSRNFGSFAAIRKGLEAASGENMAVMAADLQEPPDLAVRFFRIMSAGGADVVLGVRASRGDGPVVRACSAAFWWAYRRWVVKEMPPGGVDMFGCTARIRDDLLRMGEANTSLISQLLWVGGRREVVPYDRRAREKGRSAWTFAKKVRYMLDSVLSFSDLPIFLLLWTGVVGTLLSIGIGVVVFIAWLTGHITVPGYTPMMLTICLVGSLLMFAQGLIGSYVWRAAENTKHRPLSIVHSHERFPGVKADAAPARPSVPAHGAER